MDVRGWEKRGIIFKKIMKYIMAPSIAMTPLAVLSANLNTRSENTNINEEEIYKEKVGAYCLYDFIKLTGRLDENINIVSGNYEDANNDNYIVIYKGGGYSVFDKNKEKIVEVNPYVNFEDYYPKVISKESNKYKFENGINSFKYVNNGYDINKIQNSNKLILAKHEKNSKNISAYNKITFSNFFYEYLKEIKNSKKSDFKKNGIREEFNGFLYADYEIDNSWIFKSSGKKLFGENNLRYYLTHNQNGHPDGICGFITFNQMILYNNYFVSSNYFDREESKYIKKTQNFRVNVETFTSKMDLPTSRQDFLLGFLKQDEKSVDEQLDNYFSNLTSDEKEKYLKKHFFTPELSDEFLKSQLKKYVFPYGASFDQWKIMLDDLFENKNTKKPTLKKLYPENNNILNFIKTKKIPLVLVSKIRGLDENNNYNISDKSLHAYIAYGSYDDERILVNYNWQNGWNQMIIDIDNISYGAYLEQEKEPPLDYLFWTGYHYINGNEMTAKIRKWGFIK